MEHIWLGGPLRDQQLDTMATNIRLAGKAGITLVAYHWMCNAPTMTTASWRHSNAVLCRGGSLTSALDMDRLEPMPLLREREFSREEMWDNYEDVVSSSSSCLHSSMLWSRSAFCRSLKDITLSAD